MMHLAQCRCPPSEIASYRVGGATQYGSHRLFLFCDYLRKDKQFDKLKFVIQLLFCNTDRNDPGFDLSVSRNVDICCIENVVLNWILSRLHQQ